MTHQTERVPFLAKYPIDKWEEEGAPFVSEEGWCELLAKNKLDTLEAVFQAAKQTQTRLRHARGVKVDDVEDLRPGMLDYIRTWAPTTLELGRVSIGNRSWVERGFLATQIHLRTMKENWNGRDIY